jgi:hypothetical protein
LYVFTARPRVHLRSLTPQPNAEVKEVPVPTPAEGEVLVKVHYASAVSLRASFTLSWGKIPFLLIFRFSDARPLPHNGFDSPLAPRTCADA